MNVWKPSTKTGKVWRSHQQKTFCRAMLSGQNDDLFYEVGLLCLRIQETFELESL